MFRTTILKRTIVIAAALLSFAPSVLPQSDATGNNIAGTCMCK